MTAAMEDSKDHDRTGSDLKLIAKGAVVSSLGVFVSQYMLSPVIGVLNTRILGADQYGLFALASNIIGLMAIFPLLGLHEGLIKFLPLYLFEQNNNKVKGAYLYSMRIVTILGVVGIALCVGMTDFLSNEIYHEPRLAPILYAVAIVILINNYQYLFSGLLSAYKDIVHRTMIKYIYPNVSKLFVLILTFFFGWKLYGVLAAVLISSFVQIVLGLIFTRKTCPALSDRRIKAEFGPLDRKEILSYSLPVYLTLFVNLALQQTDGLMIGYFRDVREVGIYETAFKLTPFLLIPLSGMGQLFQPILSDLFAKNDMDHIEELYKKVTHIAVILTVPILLVLVVFPAELLNIFGYEFREGSVSLIVLSVGFIFTVITGHTVPIISLSGRPRWILYNNTGLMLTNIVLNYFMIREWGILGAALATSISVALINIFQCLQVGYLFKIHPFQSITWKPWVAGALSGGLIFFLKQGIAPEILKYLFLVLILAAFVVYFIMIYLLGLSSDEKKLLSTIRDKILERIRLGSLFSRN